MKTHLIIRKALVVVTVLVLSSCISEDVKHQMTKAMKQSQKMFADQEFKKALAHIELHKLRNGQYPKSLRELDFLNIMDSTMYSHIEYIPMDSVYELNINFGFASFDSNRKPSIKLKYPKRFWKGLGCVKSNTM